MRGVGVQHCICLLAYVSKHKGEWQTVDSLAKACGIPRRTLGELLDEARDNKEESQLFSVACSYGYEFKLLRGAGRVIDAEPRGPFPIRRR